MLLLYSLTLRPVMESVEVFEGVSTNENCLSFGKIATLVKLSMSQLGLTSVQCLDDGAEEFVCFKSSCFRCLATRHGSTNRSLGFMTLNDISLIPFHTHVA